MPPRIIDRTLSKIIQWYWYSLPSLTVRRFSCPLTQIRVVKPIFLLGTQGGGLTLLSRILRRHRDVVSCSGNSNFWCGKDELQNVAYSRLPSSLRLTRNGLSKDVTHPLFGRKVGWAYATDPILSSYRLDGTTYVEEDGDVLRKLIQKYIRAYGLSDFPRFIDKSQSYTLKTPWLRRCFPDAKFVLVARNPYALCFGRIGGTDLVDIERLRSRCNHWFNTFRTATSDLAEDEHLFLRFEDFLEQPESTLASLLSFLELPHQEDLLPSPEQSIPLGGVSREKWYPMQRNPNQKYLSMLHSHPELVKVMMSELEPIAGSLGYTPQGHENLENRPTTGQLTCDHSPGLE